MFTRISTILWKASLHTKLYILFNTMLKLSAIKRSNKTVTAMIRFTLQCHFHSKSLIFCFLYGHNLQANISKRKNKNIYFSPLHPFLKSFARIWRIIRAVKLNSPEVVTRYLSRIQLLSKFNEVDPLHGVKTKFYCLSRQKLRPWSAFLYC